MSRQTIVGAVLMVLLMAGTLTAQNLINAAESVAYDTLNNRYLVSSVRNGKIIAIDEYGIQSELFSFPGYGLSNCIKDDVLYVSTGGSPSVIRGFDLTTDTEVMTVTIPASQQCDGMSADTSGFLYIVDARTESIIWRIHLLTETPSLYENMGLNFSTQDIFFDAAQNRLLSAAYVGGTSIQAISIPDPDVTDVVPSYGGYDGITMDHRGNTYVAQSTGGIVYCYDSLFTDPPTIISTGHNQPAGVDYNIYDNILAVPNFGSSSVDFLQMIISVEADVSVGWAPMEVNFDGWVEEAVSSWSWDFGDGQTSDQQSPTHTYTEAGFYDVTLEAITTGGRDALVRVRKGMIAVLADRICFLCWAPERLPSPSFFGAS